MQKKVREISVIKERILKYLAYKGISKYECYEATGISNGVFSQTNGISEENLLKFLSYYIDINIEWLMRGVGNMLKDEDTPSTIPQWKNISGENLNEYKDKYITKLEAENILLSKLIKMKEDEITRLDNLLKGT